MFMLFSSFHSITSTIDLAYLFNKVVLFHIVWVSSNGKRHQVCPQPPRRAFQTCLMAKKHLRSYAHTIWKRTIQVNNVGIKP